MSGQDTGSSRLIFVRELACIHCAYNLQTIPVGAPCPECGKPSSDSLDSLQAAVPRDLARVRLGVMLMALAASAVPAVSALLVIVVILVPYSASRWMVEQTCSLAAAFGVGVFGPTAACVGVFLMTTPVRRASGWAGDAASPPHPSRLLLCSSALAYPMLGGLLWLLATLASTSSLGFLGRDEEPIMGIVVTSVVLGLAAWTLRNALVCGRIVSLLRRSGAPRLGRLFGLMTWISRLMFALVFFAGVSALAAYIFQNEIARSFETVTPSGGRPAIGVLFTILGILNTIVTFGFGGWTILWPIMLFVTLRHFGKAARQAATNAKGLLGLAPEPREHINGSPPAPPTSPTTTPLPPEPPHSIPS